MSGNFINNPRALVPQPKNQIPKGTFNVTKESTPVYFWYFDSASTECSIPSYSQNMPCVHDTDTTKGESIVNAVDGRTQVELKDYQVSDGRFRAIVKLFLLYDGQLSNGVTEDQATWAMATGWLVAGDIVVTAGHCAYDYSRNLGRLIKVKAYVGYTGESSAANDPVVEFRYGTAVATTDGWINTDGGDERRDVSFIKLSSSFANVSKYYSWQQTPMSQNAANLGVVGYPGDIVNDKGERGATMYQMFKQTNYDLSTSNLNMLQYQIDTYGGNSGSPVFGDQGLVAIGVHVLGGYAYNSASVITGPYGNRFEAYRNIVKLLDGTYPTDATQPDKNRSWLWMCQSTTTESDDDDPVKAGLKTTIAAAETVTADIPSGILNSENTISFGSDAGPQIGALASAAIAAAGRLAADSVNESNVELVAKTRPYDGILGRAALAECCLQCFLDLSSSDREDFCKKYSLGSTVAALKPFVLKVSPKILKGTLEPSMRLLLSNMKTNLDSSNQRKTRSDTVEKDTGFGRKLTDNESAFLNNLMDQVDHPAVESFFSTLTTIGDVIGSAFKKAGPVLLDVAKMGLPMLLGTEAGGLPPETNLDPLAHRAVLAEACLQAYIAMPESDAKSEGIFSKIIGKLKVLGPKLVKASPFVAKFVGPVVADILRGVNDQKKQEFLDFTYGK